MIRRTFGLVAATVIVAAAACSDSTSPSGNTSPLLVAAFLSTPAGFSSTNNSFSASGDAGEPWMPDRDAHENGDMMGGGLRPEFFGGVGMGHGWDRGPFGLDELLENCTFSSTTGRVTCPDVTRHGLTVSRWFEFTDAAGTAQSAPNSSTNTIKERVVVSGTVTRHDGNVTSTVDHTSEREVSGLAAGSTQRTVNGASKGTENSSGKTKDGATFTASRIVGDTTTGLVIPLQDGHPTFPTAGTVIRAMTATIAVDGKAPVTKSRREVITYNGSSNATVVITKDGTTKNCTLPLPFGRLQCQ